MESVNDIIAEIRAYGAQPPPRLMWLEIADRLESAWKRERAEVREIASTTILKERVFVGNAAALHKALIPWIPLGEWLIKNAGKDALGQGVAEMVPKLRERIDESRAAVAKPARQCDIGTAEEQAERKMKFCYKQRGCGNCSFNEGATLTQCALAWAQTPYAEEGAGK